MGLCKCPKRLVTNLFCFEHRVNVCENCIVTSHPKCIVQSYLQWLKDSDYNSSCALCGENLDTDECIRLICFHVFHWKCINSRQESLPSNTAPGGHSCPTCAEKIFPPAHLVSPVADVLRSRLSQVNWGRNELGLPLLAEEKKDMRNAIAGPSQGASGVTNTKANKDNWDAYQQPQSHSVLNIDTFNASSRRPLLAREPPIGAADRDENKYKRRPIGEIVNRWTRRLYSPTSRPPWRRTWFICLSGLLVFVLVIYVMAKVGRSGNSDGFFDINSNPNIKFE
ncbi:zinc finger protein-like 1 homolog [Lutzomyia longipalpis]|uniref:zinc finger protein-like 1 homolog n=1 Tax=Lutzomyia longipalpis TaxID=7200 RepID=UPI0024843392|nr:zinc finger protein-like 1 homolog [Lutzomyia longipalpis]